ncbi:MAG: hypothetical protein IKR54_05925 [Lachnospiraceae bacterium]|nr:hypothetical protein [Lachnospiraceae bacterium]
MKKQNEGRLWINILKVLTAFAVVCLALVTVKASAATYDPVTNTVSVGYYEVVYMFKSATGNVVNKANYYKSDGTGCFLPEINTAGIKGAKYLGSGKDIDDIKLDELGLSGSKKDVFLWVGTGDVEIAVGTSLSANLIIRAQEAVKIKGIIDYTRIDYPGDANVLSIEAYDKSQRKLDNVAFKWSDAADGTYKDSSELTGSVLATMLENGTKAIYVKAEGKSSPATFAGKPVKVKIAQQGKAPKIKVNPAKDAVALKNGFDFGYAFKDEEENWVVENWQTILPFLKTAKIKTKEATIVSTERYKPMNKKDNDSRGDGEKVAYSSYKVGILSFKDILRALGISERTDFALAVRKSATLEKPASEVQYIEMDGQTNNPIVFTESNVYGQFKVASTKDFDKKGIIIETIENYNGTSGYAETFRVATPQTSWADKNPAAYEYCVVNKDDIPKIEWSSFTWKKFVPGKTKVSSKLKTKYDTSEKKGVVAQLKVGTAPESFDTLYDSTEVPSSVSTVLLIRRTGIKTGAPVRASEYITLFVCKEGSEYVLYSTESNGEPAYKYAIDFYSFKESADGSSGEFAKDEALESITGWIKAYDTKDIKFPALTGGEYWLAEESQGKLVPSQKLTIDNAGNYELTGSGSDDTIKVIVRKYAKDITVKAVFGTRDGDKFTPITGDPLVLAFVKNGVHSGLNDETPVAGGGDPNVYVGTPFSAGGGTLGRVTTAPEGYRLTNDERELAAKGKGYCGATYGNDKITYTPLDADSAELIIYVTVEAVPEQNNQEPGDQNAG